jgi:hypothetical protein
MPERTECELRFNDVPEAGRELLRDLSRGGYIYIGRSGVGLTNRFRKLCYEVGTLKAVDETAEFHDLPSKVLLEVIATEGPRWVPYTRINEVFEKEPLMTVIRRGS